MKHSAQRKANRAELWLDEIDQKGLLADSLEVMEQHTKEKITSLEHSLNQLTIADNTTEIIFLCGEIKKQRQLLAAIALRLRRSRYSC